MFNHTCTQCKKDFQTQDNKPTKIVAGIAIHHLYPKTDTPNTFCTIRCARQFCADIATKDMVVDAAILR